MTRFVYVLPAGRLRWEVRVQPDTSVAGGNTRVPTRGRDSSGANRGPGGEPSSEPATEGPPWVRETNPGIGGPHELLDWGDEPVSIHYRRKAHALIAARAIAIVIGGEVQPHNRWGRIQDPSSFGSDPERSVG